MRWISIHLTKYNWKYLTQCFAFNAFSLSLLGTESPTGERTLRPAAPFRPMRIRALRWFKARNNLHLFLLESASWSELVGLASSPSHSFSALRARLRDVASGPRFPWTPVTVFFLCEISLMFYSIKSRKSWNLLTLKQTKTDKVKSFNEKLRLR